MKTKSDGRAITRAQLIKAIANFSCDNYLVNIIREDYETGYLRWMRQDGAKFSECWSIEENTQNRIEVEPHFINCVLLDLEWADDGEQYEEIYESDVEDLPGWKELLEDLFYAIAYTDKELEELKDLYENGEFI